MYCLIKNKHKKSAIGGGRWMRTIATMQFKPKNGCAHRMRLRSYLRPEDSVLNCA